MNIKNFYIAAIVLFSFSALLFSQQPGAPALTSKEKMLCATWKFTGTEEFGVENEPAAEQKNDSVNFGADKKAVIIKNGILLSGIWSLDKGGNYIYIASDKGGAKIMYGLKSITDEKLTLEFQTPDLVRTRYKYVKVKQKMQ